MPLEIFANLPVVPATSWHQHIPRGGPVWPDFDRQTWVRHCRNSLPCDKPPRRVDGAFAPLQGDHIWGGFLDFHFGHFVAEHLSRLVGALRARPSDVYLFTASTLDGRAHIPAWIWDVLAWFGLPADRAQIVTAPVQVERLHVAPQGEMLAQIAPSAGYLDHLDGLGGQVTPAASNILYVARTGMLAVGNGAFAGEGYLVQQLRAAGVAVLHPDAAPIAAQLAAYSGAKHIIFAEGSALHGRQILGRIAQRITVLRRRAGRKMAAAMIAPRCDGLTYADVTRAQLVPLRPNGEPAPDRAISFLDTGLLFDALGAAGIRLPWDAADFTAAETQDLRIWCARHPLSDAQAQAYSDILAPLGLGPISPSFADQRTL